MSYLGHPSCSRIDVFNMVVPPLNVEECIKEGGIL